MLDIETIKNRIYVIEDNKIVSDIKPKEKKHTNSIDVYCEVVGEHKKTKGLMFTQDNLKLKELYEWILRNCRNAEKISKLNNESIKVEYEDYYEIYSMEPGKNFNWDRVKELKYEKELNFNIQVKTYIKNIYEALNKDLDIVFITTFGDINYNILLREVKNNYNIKIYVRDKINPIQFNLKGKDIEILNINNFLNDLCEVTKDSIEILYSKYKLINPKYREILSDLLDNKDIFLKRNFRRYMTNIDTQVQNLLKYLLNVTEETDENLPDFILLIRLLNYIVNYTLKDIKSNFNEENKKNYYAKIQNKGYKLKTLNEIIQRLLLKYNYHMNKYLNLKLKTNIKVINNLKYNLDKNN